MTDQIYQRIKHRYPVEPRGEIEVKGRGKGNGKMSATLIGRRSEPAAA